MSIKDFIPYSSPEEKVTARLELELIYLDIAVQHVSHCATWTLPRTNGFLTFPNSLTRSEMQPHPVFELDSPSLLFKMITVTSSALHT